MFILKKIDLSSGERVVSIIKESDNVDELIKLKEELELENKDSNYLCLIRKKIENGKTKHYNCDLKKIED